MPITFNCTDPERKPHLYVSQPLIVTRDGKPYDVVLELDGARIEELITSAVNADSHDRLDGALTVRTTRHKPPKPRKAQVLYYTYIHHPAVQLWVQDSWFVSRSGANRSAQRRARQGRRAIVVPTYTLPTRRPPENLTDSLVTTMLGLKTKEVRLFEPDANGSE
jgi:hypothetical protein